MSPATNIPAPHDRFVGRKEEMRDVAEAIGEYRIVTLVGTGGAGKTRLALEVAADSLARYPDGVWLVPLGTAASGAEAATLTARTLGVGERLGEPAMATLRERLSDRDLLLLLDNCEHLVEPVAALVTELVAHCTTVRVLATSRELLRCQGEKAIAVSPLDAGGPGRPGPATELFIDRAVSGAPGLVLGAADVPMVEAICRRLDGLPLAIELAASRLRTISLKQLAARLDDRFRVLTGGDRDAPARQRTIESVVAWSYDLLDADEQAMFRQLSVFPDDLPLAAVEAVVAPTGCETLDVLGGLVDKSLVVANRSGEEYRYRMLETIREYGHCLLSGADELDTACRRMAVWVVGLVSRLEHDMRTPRQDAAIRAVLPERATARAAYEWALEAGEQLTALRILSAVPLMPTAQRYSELQRLRRQVPDIPEAVSAQVLLTLANLAFEIGHAQECIEHATAAARAFTALNDIRLRAWARALEALGRWTAEEPTGHFAPIFDENLAVFDEQHDEFGLAYALWLASLLAADSHTALARADRSETLFRKLGAPFGLGHCLEGRALIELEAGEPAASFAQLDEALTIFSDMENQGCTAHALEATAAVLVRRGDLFDAGRLVGAAAELRNQVGQDHRPWEREGLARTERAFADAPASVDLDGAQHEGHLLTMTEAVALARRLLSRAAGTPEGPAPDYDRLGLSPREAQVLQLLAAGCSNREISEHLIVSVKTIERHLGNLYRKLEVTNRTQAAAYAIRHDVGTDAP
jgi:predicted ATPase/DNA-binding CsgD family transcriptional regulator